MSEQNTDPARQRLKTLLSTMDLPAARLGLTDADVRWLGRNIGIRNRQHPDFQEAVRLLYSLAPQALHVWYQDAQR